MAFPSYQIFCICKLQVPYQHVAICTLQDSCVRFVMVFLYMPFVYLSHLSMHGLDCLLLVDLSCDGFQLCDAVPIEHTFKILLWPLVRWLGCFCHHLAVEHLLPWPLAEIYPITILTVPFPMRCLSFLPSRPCEQLGHQWWLIMHDHKSICERLQTVHNSFVTHCEYIMELKKPSTKYECSLNVFYTFGKISLRVFSPTRHCVLLRTRK